LVRSILVEEFHLTIRAPPGLPDDEYLAMRQALDEKRFRAELRRAVRAVLRRRPALSKARVGLTRWLPAPAGGFRCPCPGRLARGTGA
jgi:hypothetical protein